MILASGMDQRYHFYAMCFVIQDHNLSPTAVSKLKPGAAPYTTLGLEAKLQKQVPFANP